MFAPSRRPLAGLVAVLAAAAVALAALWVVTSRDPSAPTSTPTSTPTPEQPDQAADVVTIRPPAGPLMAGAPFTLRGTLDASGSRPVELQARRGARFTTVETTVSKASGVFAFEGVTLAAGRYALRAHAPSVEAGSSEASLLAAWSKPIRGVQVTSQSVTAAALPPVAQVGPTPAAAPTAPQVAARFTPASARLQAHLQQKTEQGWRTVARRRTDRAGWVVFESRPGLSYRVTAGSGRGAATSNTVAPAAWRVDFADDFSGSSVDERLWLFEQSGYTPTGQRTCSAADSSALQVSAGALRMGVRENPDRAGQVCRYARPRGRVGEHPYMFNTQINTRGKYTFKYGFAAARMKLQRARGMHSAFWLLPENWELPPGNPAGGTEVDIVEWFGHDPAPNGLGINAFIHYRDAAGGRVKIGDPREEGYRDHVALLHDEGEEWWNAYHVFSLEWTPEAYVFRVDGREFYRETRAITHTPAYISLSMLLGDYELKHLTPEGRSDAAMVDWVRVYQPQ